MWGEVSTCVGDGKDFGAQDILCLAETWWSEDRAKDFRVFEETHKHYHVCRRAGEHGGLSVFLPKTLRHKVLHKGLNPEMVVISLGEEDALLCFVYVPPQGSVALTGDPFASIVTTLAELGSHDVKFLVGDMNARVGAYDGIPMVVDVRSPWLGAVQAISGLPPRMSEDVVATQHLNTWGERLKDLCNVLELCILNGRTRGDPTGKFTFCSPSGRSVVDMVLGSAGAWALNPDLMVQDNVFSHHSSLVLKFGIRLGGTRG